MRDRNLQLERRTAELEMITEEAEREAQRLREEVARLEIDLQVLIRKLDATEIENETGRA